MKKKSIAMILAVALTFSVVGCGNGTGSDKAPAGDPVDREEKTGGEVQEDAAGTLKDTAEVDIWASYDEPVTITTVKRDLSSIIYPEGDNIDENGWTREYQKRFNINLVNEWVSDDYDTKLNLQIAEGKLPDVFVVSAPQLKQLVEADMLYDLTDLYDTYASDGIKGCEQADESSFQSAVFNGRLYGLAQLGYGNIAQPDFVWIRHDWMKEFGLSAPETMDELVNIARTFMKEKGGYGIAADKSLEFLNLIAIGWGAHPNMWVRDDNGNIVYGSTTEEMKNALADWAEWYQEGIISPEFATTDMVKANEDVINGKVGVMPYYNWWGFAVGADHISKNGFDAIFSSYNVPSANGEKVLQSIYCDNSSYVVISKDCKNPEAVFKLINFYYYMATDGPNEEPELANALNSNELPHTQMTTRIMDPTTLETEWGSINKACVTGDTTGIADKYVEHYNQIQDFLADPLNNTEKTGEYCQCGFEGSPYTLGKECFDKGNYVENVLWAYMPETLGKTGSTLGDIITEGFTKIIMGEEPISYFDTVVENWKTAGGEQATREMEELYN